MEMGNKFSKPNKTEKSDKTPVEPVNVELTVINNLSSKLADINADYLLLQLPGGDVIKREREIRAAATQFWGQSNLNDVKKKADRLQKWEIYSDADFLPNTSALFYNINRDDSQIQWKSPTDLNTNPLLFKSPPTKMVCGDLADCGFLHACLVVSQMPNLIKKILPQKDLQLRGKLYEGYIHLKFWQFGSWIDVCIDDKLPVSQNQLIYGTCGDSNEFWLPLLEKAYAKLNGSYEACEGLRYADCLTDLTGATVERFQLGNNLDKEMDLFFTIVKSVDTGALVLCTKKNAEAVETQTYGMFAEFGFTVTSAKYVAYQNVEEKLLKVRCPSDTDDFWKGDWSTSDKRWKTLDKRTTLWLDIVPGKPKEFWIRFDDFVNNFDDLSICSYDQEPLPNRSLDSCYCTVEMAGRWETGKSAGGPKTNLSSFADNPQFFVRISRTDFPKTNQNNKPPAVNQQTLSVVVALLQDYRRPERSTKLQFLPISYYIYKVGLVGEKVRRLPAGFFTSAAQVGHSGSHVNMREVVGRYELPAGLYVIIPTTADAGEAGYFLVRIFAGRKLETE